MIENDKECTGCEACKNICRQNAIKMIYSDEGFLYPYVQKEKCIQCGKCKNVCPVKQKNKKENTIIDCLVAKSRTIESDSASGGIFAVAAKYVLQKNGIVFGASYNERFQVVHTYITNVSELDKLQGSKYVQSKIGYTFRQAEKFLKKGKLVLFSGTACQIAGLKQFLGQSYEKLICIDIVCHGVPAPRVWEKYLECFHNKEKIDKINFRNEKRIEEKKFYIHFNNGKTYEKVYPQDPFVWGFCYDFFLRNTCYDCMFKKDRGNADITIGDAWGMKQYAPMLFRKKGKVSILIVNTENGNRLLQEFKKDLEFQNVQIEWIIKNNKMLRCSALYNKNREMFFCELKKRRFKSVMKKYYKKQ